MMTSSVNTTQALCELCEQYTQLFLADDCQVPSFLPSSDGRWLHHKSYGKKPEFESSDDLAFRHHDSLEALTASAKTCMLCRLVANDFAVEDRANCSGDLWLCPFSQPVISSVWKSRFHAAFSGQLDRRWDWGKGTGPPEHPDWHLSNLHSQWPLPHAFRFNKVVEYASLVDYRNLHYVKIARVIPERVPCDEFDFRPFSKLLDTCLNSHVWCRESREPIVSFPKRVIDVGTGDNALMRLCELDQNEKAKYAALTYCWGGLLSLTTTISTLELRMTELSMDDMPRTFREAITVTRRLGLRYIWIDALCIIQDSSEDWTSEAGKMASIYAGSAVTISPLNSDSSKAGIFNFELVAEITLNDTWTISKVHRNFDDDVRDAPLNRRAWCLQERLFPAAVLHIGREQIFFECLTHNVGEDGSESHWAHQLPAQRYGPPSNAAELNKYRVSVLPKWYRSPREMIVQWDALVSEFQRRSLTKGSDRLPAIAALAARVQERSGYSYIAGLWEENLLSGLCWGPYHYRLDITIMINPYVADHRPIEELRRPNDRSLPTWSWASVDGRISWKCVRDPDRTIVEFDKVVSPHVNDFMGPNMSISIALTGRITDMFYRLPEGRNNVGILSNLPDDTAPVVFDGCVMDVDRQTPRSCIVLLIGYPRSPSDSEYKTMLSLTLLILGAEECESTFIRLGICTASIEKARAEEILAPFVKRTINLI